MMNSTPSIFSKLWQLIAHPTAEQREVMGDGRPFYIMMSLLLTAVSILIIIETPSLHAPIPLAAFVVLMGLHIGLHWLSPHIATDKQGAMVYLVVQAALAFALVWVSDSPPLSLALYSALIGETIGTYGLIRLTVITVTGYLALMIGGYFIIGGLDVFMAWMPATFSTTILLIIFMVMYRRQMDVSERANKLLSELEVAHRQLADYAAQVEMLTLTAERQRMARELHDTLAQGTAGLILQLDAADNHLENGRYSRAQTIIQQAMRRARASLADVRAAIDDLRQTGDGLSFRQAIQRQAERFSRTNGIPCGLSWETDSTSTGSVFAELIEGNPVITNHASRIMGECLANVARHAQAETVQILIAQEGAALRVTVRDDGVGFDVETAVSAGHYGLQGIRERVRLVDGKVDITSEMGRGTAVIVSLPLVRGG